MGTIDKTVDREWDLTTLVVTGTCTASEVIEAMKKLYDDGPTRDIIWDLHAADVAPFDMDRFTTIINYTKSEASRRPGGRTALVGDSDTTFGMARMYEILSQVHEHPITYAALRSMQEAYDWLNLTPAKQPAT